MFAGKRSYAQINQAIHFASCPTCSTCINKGEIQQWKSEHSEVTLCAKKRKSAINMNQLDCKGVCTLHIQTCALFIHKTAQRATGTVLLKPTIGLNRYTYTAYTSNLCGGVDNESCDPPNRDTVGAPHQPPEASLHAQGCAGNASHTQSVAARIEARRQRTE